MSKTTNTITKTTGAVTEKQKKKIEANNFPTLPFEERKVAK